MNAPASGTTPLPAPQSPRDYDHLLIDDRLAGMQAQYAEERRLGLVAYAKKHGATPPPSRTRSATVDPPVLRAWVQSEAGEYRPAPISHRHARRTPQPDRWVRWTLLDLPLAGLVLLAMAVSRQRWYVAVTLFWLSIHEPSVPTALPAPAITPAVQRPDDITWRAFPTTEWPDVMGQWTAAEYAQRIGGRR